VTTDTDKILEALAQSRQASDEAHKALKAEIMKAIPDDHLEAHKNIAKFMGRMKPDDHLDDHEYTTAKRTWWMGMKSQLAKNAGNTLYFVIVSAILLWFASAIGALPHVR